MLPKSFDPLWKEKKVAIDTLHAKRKTLTMQEYRTLHGQVVAGDIQGAMDGLSKLLKRKGMRYGSRV